MTVLMESWRRLLRRLVPDPAPETCVGLDIGVCQCRMVELRRDPESGLRAVSWAVEDFGGDDLPRVVQGLMEKTTDPKAPPVTAVGGQGTLLRVVEVPRMSADEWRTSFPYEADKYFPFPRDQIHMDSCILDAERPGNKMSVLVAAAKKTLVDERIAILQEAGVALGEISLEPIALVNAFLLKDAAEMDEAGAEAILDMGRGVSTVTIVGRRGLWFTRNIFIGGEDITKGIAHSLGISIDEAERRKCDEGLSADLRDAAQSVLLNLVSELRMSFDYFVTERNMSLRRILLTGGAARLFGISELLSQFLDIPVALWDPFRAIPREGGDEAGDLDDPAPVFTVALGLAASI